VLFSHDWLPTLRRSDVTLATAAIARINPAGVRTADGAQHDCDIVVYGTGFRATEFLAPLRVTGVGGVGSRTSGPVARTPTSAWPSRTSRTCSSCMARTQTPATPRSSTSTNRRRATSCRRPNSSPPGRVLDVRPEVAIVYDTEMQTRLAGSVWVGCDSWYRAPGGRVVTNWPGSASEYRRRTARLDVADYRDPETADDPGIDESTAARFGAHPNVIRKSASVTVTRGRSPRR